jgi:hypothetical protein
MENLRVPESELDKPIGGTKTKLPLLPELEMLESTITDVVLQYSMFQGKPNYAKNENGENILDKDGNPIQKKEFQITFCFKNHSLSDGKPRKQWLKLGASVNEKSKLKKFLALLGIQIAEGSIKSLKQLVLLVESIKGYEVKFQLVNKPDAKGEVWQNINFDSIRLVSKAKNTPSEELDIDWQE